MPALFLGNLSHLQGFNDQLPLLLLLCLFSRVRLCATPQTAAHQAPLSLGFSRQEYWSGLPFPSPLMTNYTLIIPKLHREFWLFWTLHLGFQFPTTHMHLETPRKPHQNNLFLPCCSRTPFTCSSTYISILLMALSIIQDSKTDNLFFFHLSCPGPLVQLVSRSRKPSFKVSLREKETLLHCRWNVNSCSHYGEQYGGLWQNQYSTVK